MAKCETVNQVYEEYVEIAKRLDTKNKRILKTDCHNESFIYGHSIPIIPVIKDAKQIFVLDYDWNVIEKARHILNECGVKVCHGSIVSPRDFFNDGELDIVMDFSTIDHVTLEDLPVVISEYNKILKKGGVISLVIWTSDKYVVEANGKQMYFPKGQVDTIMNENFKIVEAYCLFEQYNKRLWYYRGIKE